MSKLAALAAKRRQQEASKSSSTDSDQLRSADDYTETLNKLRISQTSRNPATTSAAVEGGGDESPALGNISEYKDETNQENPSAQQDESELPMDQHLRAGPSAFATLLVGTATAVAPEKLTSVLQPEARPVAFDFSKPSPDDIIDKAQTSKGRPQA
jgi:hypothetical protein